MLKKVFAILFLFLTPPLSAQEMSDEYERMFGEREAFGEAPADSLFYSMGGGLFVFGRLSRYNFNFISYRNRGYDGRNSKHYLENLDISPVTDKYPDYSLYGALRVSATDIREYTDSADALAGGGFGSAFYGADPSRARPGVGVRADYSEIHYRGGLRLTAAGNLGKGWTAAFNGRYRDGRDKFIGGVFSESLIVSASAGKDFRGGGRLTFFGMVAASERGIRNWTVGEVYELTGDNLYNPSWGWLAGKPRNSNVRDDANGLFAATYSKRTGITDIKLSAMYRRSERGRSRLLWRNAASPMPDHYANLPSHYSDPLTAALLADAWRTDTDIRQIDWDRLYDINRNSGDGSVYIVGEDVGRINGFRAAVSGTSRFSKIFALDYGLRFSCDNNTFYRRAEDLLGGEYYFEYISPDERERIGQGDRFDYDFRIPRNSGTTYVSGAAEKGKWTVRFAAELSYASVFRKSGNGAEYAAQAGMSSGSGRIGFAAYDVKLAACYRFSDSHKLSAAVWTGSREPSYQDIFLGPQSGGLTAPDISCVLAGGAEVRYSGRLSQQVTMELAAHYTLTGRETVIYRYYDNAVSEYMIMSLNGVSKRFAGVEAAVKADITDRFSVMAGCSVNEYVYARDATADFYRSAGMESLAEDDACHIEGLVCSPSPQTMFVISATYSIPRTWSFGASFTYGGSRYAAINPVRRTDRILDLASSLETVEDFMKQERLPAASALDLTVSRRFRLRGCYAYVGVTVSNLLGRKNMVYGAYEQMRIEGGGNVINRTYSPAPSRYAYCYPRSVFATVSINF